MNSSRHARFRALTLCILSFVLLPGLRGDLIGGTADPAHVRADRSGAAASWDAAGRVRADGRTPVWVFFRDRGFQDEVELRAALIDREARLSAKVLRRRAKAMGRRRVLEGDLPLNAGYVDAVMAVGVRLRHRSRWLNAVSVDATPAEIERLAALPFVRRVQPVARLGRVAPLRPTPGSPEAPGGSEAVHSLDYGPSLGQLEQINVPAVHDSGFSGAGVVVMMLDTGFFKEHEALAPLDVIAEWDFVFEDDETQDEPEDVPGQHSHGTATWSALGGYSPGNLIGPAYGASFLLAKTEDLASETPAEEDNYVAALEWADTLGVDVTSASLAYLDFDPPFSDYIYGDLDGNTAVISVAIDEAARRGIVVCNAIANEGPDLRTLWTPSDADSMIACGAVDPFGQIASFSSRGPTFDGRIKPEVVARGIDTWAASSGGGYGSYGGTSLSTPLVGGAAALVVEAHPEWGPMQVREALMATADRAASPDNSYGSGLIDVWSAIYEPGIELTPTSFSLVDPAPGDTVAIGSISFSWTASVDPIGRHVDYKLSLAADSAFTDPLIYPDIPENDFTLTDSLSEGRWFWKVSAYNNQGFFRASDEVGRFYAGLLAGIGDDGPDGGRLPKAFALGQNYPNPFNPRTTIAFEVPEPDGGGSTPVRLTVHDLRGRQVRVLFDGEAEGGEYRFSWDGRDGSGRTMASGVYLYRLTAGDRALVRKMVLGK
jgi:subtilisin family serine protease